MISDGFLRIFSYHRQVIDHHPLIMITVIFNLRTRNCSKQDRIVNGLGSWRASSTSRRNIIRCCLMSLFVWGVTLLKCPNFHNNGSWAISLDNHTLVDMSLLGHAHNQVMSYNLLGHSAVVSQVLELLNGDREDSSHQGKLPLLHLLGGEPLATEVAAPAFTSLPLIGTGTCTSTSTSTWSLIGTWQ